MPKIFINPGHAPNGNPDPGAVNPNTNLRESDVTCSIGQLVSSYLQAVGYQTVIMQSDSLEDICSSANSETSDLFVSIHCNAADNTEASGTETWYLTKSVEGKTLAATVQREIIHLLGTVNRGLKESIPGESGLYVLENTNMPAILVETAFISNDTDESILRSLITRDQFARAIALGITDYYALKNGGSTID